ncbi:MAG TPA: 4-hydroxy-tetrahydrodipicolinate synthase [archaeon]|nr:4-hydroxy-tetrahydrodipicolinate synthase [archaeon]
MNVSGVYTAMVTPFKNNKVDFEGFRKNVEFQIKNGVDGIVPIGTTGEAPTLSHEEKEQLIKTAVKTAKGKVNVMIGTGSYSTSQTIENTKMAKELGADMALIVTPYYNKPTQEGLYRHFKAITEEVDFPVFVYNIKGRTGQNIETPTLRRIVDLPNIIGVKEASGDINQMCDVINTICSDHETFSVMSGDDGLTVPLMVLGGKGVISVVSNIVPAKVVEMVKYGLENDFVNARRIHYELLPIFKGAFIETNPIPIKEAMNMLGMPAGECRLPLCEMGPENREKLKEILKQMNLIK